MGFIFFFLTWIITGSFLKAALIWLLAEIFISEGRKEL